MGAARSRPLSSPLLAVLFGGLAVAALMQSTVLVMIDPTLLGWRPDHGHIYLDGQVVPHHHPWDAPGTYGTDGASTAGRATPGVVFTPGDDGSAGSVAGALTVPAAPLVVPAALPPRLIAAADLAVPLDVPAEVPAPPPRG